VCVVRYRTRENGGGDERVSYNGGTESQLTTAAADGCCCRGGWRLAAAISVRRIHHRTVRYSDVYRYGEIRWRDSFWRRRELNVGVVRERDFRRETVFSDAVLLDVLTYGGRETRKKININK